MLLCKTSSQIMIDSQMFHPRVLGWRIPHASSTSDPTCTNTASALPTMSLLVFTSQHEILSIRAPCVSLMLLPSVLKPFTRKLHPRTLSSAIHGAVMKSPSGSSRAYLRFPSPLKPVPASCSPKGTTRSRNAVRRPWKMVFNTHGSTRAASTSGAQRSCLRPSTACSNGTSRPIYAMRI